MEKFKILLLGLVFMSITGFARTELYCSDSLYVGKTIFRANLVDGTFLVERELIETSPQITYETIFEGQITNLTTAGTGIITLLELEASTGEIGFIQISIKSPPDELPRFVRPAKLQLENREYGLGLICF